jgi:hypothetical protein
MPRVTWRDFGQDVKELSMRDDDALRRVAHSDGSMSRKRGGPRAPLHRAIAALAQSRPKRSMSALVVDDGASYPAWPTDRTSCGQLPSPAIQGMAPSTS